MIRLIIYFDARSQGPGVDHVVAAPSSVVTLSDGDVPLRALTIYFRLWLIINRDLFSGNLNERLILIAALQRTVLDRENTNSSIDNKSDHNVSRSCTSRWSRSLIK